MAGVGAAGSKDISRQRHSEHNFCLSSVREDGLNINLHKIFKNNNRLMKLPGIVYLYLDLSSKDLL
jgi:hypothetical protein